MTKIELPLPEGAKAFYTLRGTDRSNDPYEGFSICHYTSDDPERVEECRHMLCRDLAIERHALIVPRQTHSANVAVIDCIPHESALTENTDALVTRLRGVVLCINTADCVPIVFYDPVHKVIGAAHSGWRGTVAEIGAATVRAMCRAGADTTAIYAAMGPSVCPRCFEVGEEVAERFRNRFSDQAIVTTGRYPKPHVDLGRAIAESLINAGVPAGHIAMPPECSMCSPHRLFSARRLGVASGRTLTAIYMS